MARQIRTDIENNGKIDHLSKPILRTNPRLSTNVKLVVTDEDMYLESIDASSLLSSSNYKKYLIKESGSYAYDLAKFWRLNSTPLDLAFKTKRDYSDFSVLESYDKQYEESYSYGTTTNYSKLYDYHYRMFAPIWLDKNIPSKFIIYRIDDPVDKEKFTQDTNLDRIVKMLSKATLIKTVDLSENSKIGKYLRNYVNDEAFPASPLTVSFGKDEQTSYNGIDLDKGGFVSKGEYQYKDTLNVDKPLIEYNQFITEGFFRNSVACANLINLEFLFDDDETPEFSINRYFGIFVDTYKIGEGVVDTIKGDLITFGDIEHSLDLNGGDDYWSIPYSGFYKKSPMLGWVKSFSDYHNVKNGVEWDISKKELRIDSNGRDYSLFTGIKKTDRNVELTANTIGSTDFIKIEIAANPVNGDTFGVHVLKKQRFKISIIENATGNIDIVDNLGTTFTVATQPTTQDTLEEIKNNWPNTGNFSKYEPIIESTNGDYQITIIEKEYNFEVDHNFSSSPTAPGNTILKIERTFTPMQIVENTFVCDNTIDRGKFNGNLFSGNGTLNNVANAISNMIETNTRFSTVLEGSIIYIKSPIVGYNRKNTSFSLKNSNSQFLNIEEGLDVSNSLNINSAELILNQHYFMRGGSDVNKSIYIKEDDVDQIRIGEYLLDRDGTYNKVIDVAEDSRTINSEFNLLVLENKNKRIEGINNVYREFRLEWGMFSAYNIYDLNFDFYDTSNSDLKELELEYNDPDDNSWEYLNSDPVNILNPNQPYLVAYSDLEALNEESLEYYSNLIPILNDEETEDKDVEKIYSEFDRLKENYTTEFATTSRIIPTINKWCLKNSTNVRENPYYLNVDESFAETNFSANLETEGRDPKQMTHEWFYIDKFPEYVTYQNANSVFSYLNLATDVKIDIEKLKDVDFDYFKSFFIGTGHLAERDGLFAKSKKLKKYTLIGGGNAQNFSSTIFKGLKFTPKLRKDLQDKITREFVKSSEFNDYRFSAYLNTTYDTNSPNSLDVKVIENKKFKFIVLVLDLTLSDSFDFLNRRHLYELDHKIDGTGFQYADSSISGALDLSQTQISSTGTTIIVGMPDLNGIETKFTTQILKDPITGAYSDLLLTVDGIDYTIQVTNVISDNEIEITEGMKRKSDGIIQSPTYYSNVDYKNASYGYKGGGIFAHRSLLEQLSANNIADVLNNTNDAEYITVEEDGTLINNRFTLTMEDGVEIIKTSTLYPEVDINKPKSFKLSNQVIGYNIQDRNEYFAFLVRQNGNYTVDMNPIVTFTEPFSNHKIDTDWTTEDYDATLYNYNILDTDLNNLTSALYKKFNLCGVLFNIGEVKDPSHDLNWGVIKNHFFHKVNEIETEGVIKLSPADDLLPKYQLINEIAIDKKDKNIFKSRWEGDYYTRSLDAGSSISLPGTKNVVEEKSYISSSVIKTGESYDLFNFTTQQFESIDNLNDIKAAGITKADVNFTETDTQIIADFYLDKNLIKFLDARGVRNTLSRYVKVEDSFGRVDTLNDDIEGYISENILKLYSVSSINLYVLEAKKISTKIESAESIGGIESGGYELNNNFSFKLDTANPLNFRLIYNKRIGFSYEIRPLIKIKA